MKARSSRQSFLKVNSDSLLADTVIAIVGVSGGGSPFATVHLIDPDFAEEHHRHRLVGISSGAIKQKRKKVRVVKSLMNRVQKALS